MPFWRTAVTPQIAINSPHYAISFLLINYFDMCTTVECNLNPSATLCSGYIKGELESYLSDDLVCLLNRETNTFTNVAKVLDTKLLASALYLPQTTKGLPFQVPDFFCVPISFGDQSMHGSYDYMFSTIGSSTHAYYSTNVSFHDEDIDEELPNVRSDEDNLPDLECYYGQYGMEECD
jgi:hypothetical protein